MLCSVVCSAPVLPVSLCHIKIYQNIAYFVLVTVGVLVFMLSGIFVIVSVQFFL